MKEGRIVIVSQTALQKEISKLPSSLEFVRAKKYRGLLRTNKELRNLYRLETGAIGEEKVFNLFKSEGRNHWVVLCNLWMDDDRSFECDFLVITSYCVYTFEIKHLTGHFIYEDSSCEINGTKMDYDLIQQARKPYIKLRKILDRVSPVIPLKGGIVFTSDKNKVTINSAVADIDVLQMPDLYEYIKQMKKDETKNSDEKLPTSQLFKTFENYEIVDPFLPNPLSAEEMKIIRKGIYCAKCKKYGVEITKNYVICRCGLHEPRIEAIVRTVCEYGVLNFDKHFTIKDIRVFTDYKHSHGYLKNILDTYFEGTFNHRYSYYHNIQRPFKEIQDSLDFKLPKLYYTSRKSPEIYIIE